MGATKNNKDIQKENMLNALEHSLGVVKTACDKTGIHRSTHYRWCEEDEDYAKAVDMVQGIAVDFAETKLFKNIDKGKEASIIFFLKTRGKKRGYVEKTEVEQTSHVTVDFSDED